MEWWYKTPAAGKIRGIRMGLLGRIALRRRRKHTDDLANVRGW